MDIFDIKTWYNYEIPNEWKNELKTHSGLISEEKGFWRAFKSAHKINFDDLKELLRVKQFSLNTPVDTIEPISKFSELEIFISSNFNHAYKEIKFLQKCRKLERLTIRDNRNIIDWEFLNTMANLKVLKLVGTNFRDLKNIENIKYLEHLELNNLKNEDYSILSKLTNLCSISLNSCDVRDLSFVYSLSNIFSLNIEYTMVDNDQILKLKSKMPNIEIKY